MEVTQVYSLVNDATNSVLGTIDILNQDLSNVVDVGTQIFNANAVDRFVNTLVDRIGRTVFVARKYSGVAPSILIDQMEYGCVLMKVSGSLPEATINENWELVDGASYDPNIFHKPKVAAKFFSKRVTFEVDRSIATEQVKSAFNSASELNQFVSMLFVDIENSITVKMDALISMTIANMIGETFAAEFPTGEGYDANSTVKAVNLLKLYNDKFTKNLDADACLTDPEFIRFAAYTMALYSDRIKKLSTLFNIGKEPRFTPNDRLHFITLSDFSTAADIYLQSDTYHDVYTRLPQSEKVPYWQGSGEDYSFAHVSEIHITTGSGKQVNATGILGVMFDRYALGVSKLERSVTTHYNPKADFTNYFYKQFAGYYNDTNENFVVFYVA